MRGARQAGLCLGAEDATARPLTSRGKQREFFLLASHEYDGLPRCRPGATHQKGQRVVLNRPQHTLHTSVQVCLQACTEPEIEPDSSLSAGSPRSRIVPVLSGLASLVWNAPASIVELMTGRTAPPQEHSEIGGANTAFA